MTQMPGREEVPAEAVARFPDETRTAIRETVEKMAAADPIPKDEFSGDKGIYMANLEGFLGRFTIHLLKALEATEAERDNARNQERQRIQEALETEIAEFNRLATMATAPAHEAIWITAADRLRALLDTFDPSGEEGRTQFQCHGPGCKRDYEVEGHATLPIDWATGSGAAIYCPNCDPSGEQGEEKQAVEEWERVAPADLEAGDVIRLDVFDLQEGWQRERREVLSDDGRTLRLLGDWDGEDHEYDWVPAEDKHCNGQHSVQRVIERLKPTVPATDPSKEEPEGPEQCERPPLGWRCTRDAGHDGPCATVPSIVDRLLRASSKEVGGDGE